MIQLTDEQLSQLEDLARDVRKHAARFSEPEHRAMLLDSALELAQAVYPAEIQEEHDQADPFPITVVRAEQTCAACPSQWDAWTADGRVLYLRYRYGQGTAQIGGPAGDMIASFSHGDPLDGWISLEQFCQLAGLGLEVNA